MYDHEITKKIDYFVIAKVFTCFFVIIFMKKIPKPNKHRTRIKDIAVRANVSVGTVDRVLHDRGEVSRETRERVLKIISELNYEPDILASALASKKNYQIAALIPESNKESRFWDSPLKGLSRASEEIKHFDFNLNNFFFDQNSKKSFREQSLNILDLAPDGVIIVPFFGELAGQFCQGLDKKKIPYILMNSSFPNSNGLGFVGQNAFHSGRVAAKLMAHGMRDPFSVLIVNFTRENGNTNHILEREKGFKSYINESLKNRVEVLSLNISEFENNKIDKILSGYNYLFNSHHGIFVTSSRVFKVAAYISKLQHDKPRLIGYDLLDENKTYLLDDTIDFLISQKPEEQGYKSMLALYNHLIFRKPIDKEYFVPIDIITKENLLYYNN